MEPPVKLKQFSDMFDEYCVCKIHADVLRSLFERKTKQGSVKKKIEKSFLKTHVYAYTANMKCALIFRSPGFVHARKIAEFMANSI